MTPYFQILSTYLLTIFFSFCECVTNSFHTQSSYEDEYAGETTPFIGRMFMDFEAEIKPMSGNHTATLIFLHSLSEIGTTMMDRIVNDKESFKFDNTKILFPTAPLRPYTPHKGELRYVWNDVTEESFKSKELLETFEQNYRDLKTLIMKEVANGIPLHKIAIGGYAEGGPMALHMGYRIMPELGGVFVLSSCLFKNSIVFKELREKRPEKLPKLLWIQGDRSPSFVHAKEQYDEFVELGVRGEFVAQKDLNANLNREQIDILDMWIMSTLEVDEVKTTPKYTKPNFRKVT